MAQCNYLTDLPNRLLFRELLEQALSELGDGKGLAVLYLDLDHFKSVNDTLGHPVGDELLKTVAVRLSRCVGSKDIVARLGGDEFAIIQKDAGKQSQVLDLVDQSIGLSESLRTLVAINWLLIPALALHWFQITAPTPTSC